MRTARLGLAAMAIALAGQAVNAESTIPADPAQVPGSPSWAKDSPTSAPGFAPLAVTQSGVTYAPGDPIGADATQDAQPLADLPAWAAPARDKPQPHDVIGDLELGRFDSLPEPAIWALLLTGFAIIGGALRGIILANRRLHRLRPEEEEPSEDE